LIETRNSIQRERSPRDEGKSNHTYLTTKTLSGVYGTARDGDIGGERQRSVVAARGRIEEKGGLKRGHLTMGV